MAEQLFLFVQLELPWELGPPDGRYLVRRHGGSDADGDPDVDRVVVLETLGAQRRHGRLAARRRPTVEPEPEPAAVPTTRATMIDPVPVSAERQAQAWLAHLDVEREVVATGAILNRVLHAYRIAAADPHMHGLSCAQALVVRAGWGEGEQVAYGHWLHARELRRRERRAQRRAVLQPQERFAALLGVREHALLCEELALRARADIDEGRTAHAALELEQAYAAALAELSPERHPDLALRLAELQQLHPGVCTAARAALAAAAADTPAELDAEALAHALGRLEAVLRARVAVGLAAS